MRTPTPLHALPRARQDKTRASGAGRFYIIDLVPELSDGRVRLKCGFSRNVAQRLAALRKVSPTARLLGTCPCDDVSEEYRIIRYIASWLEGERITREVCDVWRTRSEICAFARCSLESWEDGR